MADDRELVANALARPWTYARAKLGMTLHSKQEAVLRDWYVPGSRTVARCGNEVGKTSRLAVAAILHHAEVLGGMVVSTAGVARQVKTQLIPNLQSHSHRYPGWKFNDDSIYDQNGRLRYLGFTAANEGNFQGFHNLDGPLGIILDETAAIADKLIIAAEERCNPTRFLMMGSTLDPAGQFYNACTSLAKFYKQHKITQLDCPWISRETIQRRIEKYGPEHPIVLSSIFAEFAISVENALLSLREWDGCLEANANGTPIPQGDERHVFLDFAAGRAENVIGCRVGNRAWIEKAWREKNTMAAIGEFISNLNRLAKPAPVGIRLRPEEVEGDADGMGIVFCQALGEAGWPVIHFHGNSKPLINNEYGNRIAEVWTEQTILIRKKEWIIGRAAPGGQPAAPDEELKAQVINRKAGRNSKGQLTIESKEDMTARGVISPDRADALLGAMAPRPMTSSVNLTDPFVQRTFLEQANEDQGGGQLPGASC